MGHVRCDRRGIGEGGPTKYGANRSVGRCRALQVRGRRTRTTTVQDIVRPCTEQVYSLSEARNVG
jgi:hypothetical protein